MSLKSEPSREFMTGHDLSVGSTVKSKPVIKFEPTVQSNCNSARWTRYTRHVFLSFGIIFTRFVIKKTRSLTPIGTCTFVQTLLRWEKTVRGVCAIMGVIAPKAQNLYSKWHTFLKMRWLIGMRRGSSLVSHQTSKAEVPGLNPAFPTMMLGRCRVTL